MFPSNLHKNIVQLDRQISLLENECKNMEVDKRKKGFKPESCYGKSIKNSGSQLKPSPVKLTLRNSDLSRRNKKITSPLSGRLQSASSLPSHCSQSWSDTYETAAGKKSKMCKINTNIPACSCRKSNGIQCNSRKKNKCLNCDYFKESSTLDLHKVDCVGGHKHQVLHKELLYSNSDGTIEVTVTQKPSSGKQISPIKKAIDLEDKKDKESCKCQIKGQKWSEILCLDTSKRKSINKEDLQNKLIGDETKTINQPFTSSNGYESNRSQENINNSNNINNLSIQEENFEVPVKLSPPPYKIKNQQQIISNRLEKEVQCALENIVHKEPVEDSEDPIKIIQHLVNQLKQMPINELKELPKDVRMIAKKTLPKEPLSLKELPKETKELFACGDTAQSNTSLEVVKLQCDNLIKDRELLSKELAAKDFIIATMNKREEEYLSLINGLKLNLEKTQESAQGNIETIKEMNILKDKLFEKMKFIETVQKNYNRAHDLLEKYIMENQKLKTQIKILILEAQKHEVLLAGKDAEINKYKEEILNFQRQISDHLASLKSNAQGVDIEKMVQAIFQQSQIFLQTDLDSVLVENDQKDTSKQQNVLMHSSPTSSKTSVVNSSWKQISSIHDQDRNKENSDFNLNDDSHAKDFFQIFGDNSSSETKSTKKSKQILLENLLDENNIKRSLSFTSCMSVHDDQNSNSESSSSDRDSLISNNESLSNEEKGASDLKKINRVSFEKAQSNIDEVLKNMKLNFSKKIFETSLANCTIDDFLDSQISSASQ